MRSYLLLLRFVAFNVVALALLAAAWLEGWAALVLAADVTRITSGIAVVFAAGWLVSAYRLMRCSRELNAARDPASGERPGSDGAGGYAARELHQRDTAHTKVQHKHKQIPEDSGCSGHRQEHHMCVVDAICDLKHSDEWTQHGNCK